ncbi:amidohydrolase [Candidatus Hecatella orcuttiae]|uniref:amidohydrolase family protein n=1 Tax=Candidatus Hecatella orcuttiae TaxID=1935119 RepID=UPI0028682C56|nr:amidohydrolase [Candidatus Hecatella orcuttiae]
MSLAIEGGTIITLDKNRPIIKNGLLVVQDGEITFVGEKSEFKESLDVERRIDASGKFVFPGFINAHNHMFQVFIRSVAVDMELLDWLKLAIWPFTQSLTESDIYVAARLAIIENIKSGITCIVDNQYPRFYEPVAKAMDETGIRGVLACGYYELNVLDEMKTEPSEALKKCEETLRKWDKAGGGRIRVCPAPMHPCFASDELILKSKELADKYDTYLHIHTAESERDVRMLMERTGKRDVEYLHDLGVLDSRFLAVHSVCVTKREIDLLVASGAQIVHNPISNMYVCDGVAPIPEYIRRGLNVALGTDGSASNGNQDFLSSMKFAALLHKVYHMDPSIIKAQDSLEMATINGAKALSMGDRLGSLQVGKRADITIVDMFKPHTVHVHDPVGSLVYSCTPENVDTVIVDGKILMENRRITFTDEEEELRKADEVAQAVKERARI